jgi:iron-sulfur cluster repair protein YtfE (RIC family)
MRNITVAATEKGLELDEIAARLHRMQVVEKERLRQWRDQSKQPLTVLTATWVAQAFLSRVAS